MTRPYKLSSRKPLTPTHPLHWGKFWPDLQRLHRSRNEARQDLVLWLANLYSGAIKCGLPIGFCSVQIRLTDLRKWVRDYQPALHYFFEIKQRGYFVSEETQDITTLVPKRLEAHQLELIESAVQDIRYDPPALPDDTVISKVYLRPGLVEKDLVNRVLVGGRPEIVPQLKWLLKQPNELNFHFIRSGKLQLRDTSVWPISAIENWPGWLREELFGPGIDLDSAYVQFLVQTLRRKFEANPEMVDLLFSDLVRLLDDKEAFREELCTEVLGLPFTSKNRSLVKRIIMSLANGSKISPTLLTSGAGFSLTAGLIIEANKEASVADLNTIGERLRIIANQFASARKHACMFLLNKAPNRENVKKVFGSYFEWERAARYAVWEEVGRHGIMVHDGIDGIPQEELDRLPEIIQNLGLKLTT